MEVTPVDVEKVAAENPQSRFRIVNTAIMKPGVCALCGSDGGDSRQFVDFGKTMDWYGCVYFCTFCVAEAAALLGLRSSLEAESHIQGFMASQKTHLAMIEELREQLNAARLLLRNCDCESRVTGPADPDFVEADSEPEPSDSNPDESGDVQESGDVHDPSDGDEPEPAPKRTRRSSKSE